MPFGESVLFLFGVVLFLSAGRSPSDHPGGAALSALLRSSQLKDTALIGCWNGFVLLGCVLHVVGPAMFCFLHSHQLSLHLLKTDGLRE